MATNDLPPFDLNVDFARDFHVEPQSTWKYSKYLYIQKRSGGARNRDLAFDVPIHDCTNAPDLDDMITNGPGEVTICEGDNDEMSWEWDDYIIVKTG